MGLIICRRCGNAYDRDRWDKCLHCTRLNIIPFPHFSKPYLERAAPLHSWAEVMCRGGHQLYTPRMYIKMNINQIQ